MKAGGMTTEIGPFRLPRFAGDTKKLVASGEQTRVLQSDEANVYATYCGECVFIWNAPVGDLQTALRTTSEHREIHRIWDEAEQS